MSENPESFFREVDEGVRRDRMIALVRRYGPPAVLLIVLLLAGVLGWRVYEVRQEANLREQAAVYSAALDAAGLGVSVVAAGEETPPEVDPRTAAAAFADAAARIEGGYRHLARLHEAGFLVRERDFAGALTLYDAVAAETDDANLRGFAAFLAASAALEAEGPDAAIARLEPLAAPGAALRFSALELLGVAHLRAGDKEAAISRLAAILEDPEAPAELRRRAEEMMAALGGDVP